MLSPDIIYHVKSFPILFELNPNALDPAVITAYPRLMTGEVQYGPEFKELSITSVGDVKLNPALDEYGTTGFHKETFNFPPAANSSKEQIYTRKTQGVIQANFENQVLLKPLDPSKYRDIFTSVGIHLIIPADQTFGLNPFMVVYNGVSEHPLILRNLAGSSFNKIVKTVSSLVFHYLFGE